MYQRISLGNYTPTLRDLDQAGVEIFNDWWDTYIPEHKPELIRKIKHTYYFEQIGCETPDQFVHYINAQLERIMPYYNQLYASELIKINPLLNHSIETSGRSIENLLAKANTTDDKFAKAIREFAGVTDKSSEQSAIGTSTGEANKHDQGHEEYKKQGTENIKDNSKTTGSENEQYHETKISDGSSTTNETQRADTTDTRNLDKTVTEKPDEKTVKEMQWGQTQTGSEKVVGKDTSDGQGTKNWTETRDDDSTTKTVTDLDETSSSSSEKDYADTPQTQLNVSADDGTSNIRKDYLTNVTWTSENGKHNADTTQDVTFTDDETKTHEESTTDKNTIDKTQDTDTTMQKGGTDTETSTHTGTNIITTVETENATKEHNANTNSTTTTKDTINTDGTRDNLSEENTDATRDKNWSENGSSDSTFDSRTNTTNNTKSSGQSSGSEQTRETADLSQSSVSNQEKISEETRDNGKSSTMTGFMNVSSSALLEAFRKTFLNVDNMIIEELRDNFMLVY